MRNSYTGDYKKITDALLSDKGVQHITDTAFEVFGCPIVVIDTSYRFLSRCFNSDALDRAEKVYDYFTNGDLTRQQFLDKKGIEALKADKVINTLTVESHVHKFTHSILGCNCIAAGIRIKNTLVAVSVLFEVNREFTSDDEALFKVFTDCISQELQKNRMYQANRDEYASYLLNDLLTNKYPDEKLMEKRLKTIDFTPSDCMNIVVIRSRKTENDTVFMEMVALQLKSALFGHLYAIIDDALVLLLNLKKDKGLEGYLLDKIEQICKSNNLIAGISSDFSSLSKLTQQYRLAVRAALVCQRYIEDMFVIRYDDVFDLALLEYCERHNNLMDFVHSSIIKLMEYDEQFGTDYLHTLWAYSENGFNIQKTAASIFMHKNTLAYRLTKIKEILGSDLTNGKDLFAFQLSMRILRMLGKLKK